MSSLTPVTRLQPCNTGGTIWIANELPSNTKAILRLRVVEHVLSANISLLPLVNDSYELSGITGV